MPSIVLRSRRGSSAASAASQRSIAGTTAAGSRAASSRVARYRTRLSRWPKSAASSSSDAAAIFGSGPAGCPLAVTRQIRPDSRSRRLSRSEY